MADQKDRILIVEDDPVFSKLLENILQSRFEVVATDGIERARQLLQVEAIAGVLLDVRLQGKESSDADGILLLQEIREDRPLLPVLVMTAYGDVDLAVQAMKFGANDFVEKGRIEPAELGKLIRDLIAKARANLRTQAEAAEMRQLQPSLLVGNGAAILPVRRNIELAARDGYCSVLILGETGSGKEVVARSIHREGWRREGPFVPVPMAGLSPSLLESELFGHEKGSFTGADKTHEGYIEKAEGGVLFLDEIGDLSLDLQAKLLRVLEEKLVFRVGSTRGRPVNTQVIAATHRPLKERVEKELFRGDLYFRLKTVEIVVPPLRDHPEDIPLLADNFLHSLRSQGRTKLAGFANPAVLAIRQYGWPGNVRQLRGVIEWAVLAAMQAGHWVVEVEDLPTEIRTTQLQTIEVVAGNSFSVPLIVEQAKARAELECIERALVQANGKKQKAMELLGYPNRQTMRRRIQQLHERFPELWQSFPSLVEAYQKVDGERNEDDS
jgi:DNA-binding NtrC family response regulator